MRVLVTGASGFVGSAVLPALRAKGHMVRAAVRREADCDADEQVRVGDLSPDADWRDAVRGIDAVVHLAARVHVMHDTSPDPLAEFRRSNVEGTLALARAAAAAGAKRMVFLSSIKVNGEATTDRPFTERDAPAPKDPYGVSKAEAEAGLARVATESGLELVVLRPPLVYGPGVRANFLRLVRLADRGAPLPFGAVDNRRSMVFVGNLADAIVRCVEHPAAAGRTFLVSDGEDLSTSDLIARLAKALGKRATLVPVPPALMRAAARLLGKSAEADRLLGSLRIDSSALRASLAWQPPFTVDEGLAATAAWYRSAQHAEE
jgi:nucleoside-diphosphate-sugar epimerase